ncbi:hypothetical protein GP486_002516 [Trichoglossum hirsutum]|uniref:Fungal-type protein kinase domain-containing protein n=1 Tax=Trichoglossum hirsutum TaxID=265104 RepID=A0A9P8LEX4_9PEZI|nr:hypothetical protein GP486_002516 [Trichoglossum hirsutum]
MNEKQLEFDPTILESDSKRYVDIMRNDKTERLVIVELMKRHSSVAGRVTTCWKAYYDRDESKWILVIKDSWQYPERGEEGKLLCDATEKGVINVVRYYHHKTVHIGGKDDDINSNVQKGLGIMKATDAFLHTSVIRKTEDTMPPLSTSGGRSRSTVHKRSSSSFNAPLPSNK